MGNTNQLTGGINMISLKVKQFRALIRQTEYGTFVVVIRKGHVRVQVRYFFTEHTAKQWARDAVNAPTLKAA